MHSMPQGVEYDFLHLDDSQSAGMPTTLQPGKNLFILFVVSLFYCLNKVKEKGHIGLQKWFSMTVKSKESSGIS